MKFLLDTCVISEMIKSSPNQQVISWIGEAQEEDFYLSVLTIGELQKDVAKLKSGKRKKKTPSLDRRGSEREI